MFRRGCFENFEEGSGFSHIITWSCCFKQHITRRANVAETRISWGCISHLKLNPTKEASSKRWQTLKKKKKESPIVAIEGKILGFHWLNLLIGRLLESSAKSCSGLVQWGLCWLPVGKVSRRKAFLANIRTTGAPYPLEILVSEL